jgi:hypothetical protein
MIVLAVRLEDAFRNELFLIEVATEPECRMGQQFAADRMLAYLERGELPEAATVMQRPKGNDRIPRGRNLCSHHGRDDA